MKVQLGSLGEPPAYMPKFRAVAEKVMAAADARQMSHPGYVRSMARHDARLPPGYDPFRAPGYPVDLVEARRAARRQGGKPLRDPHFNPVQHPALGGVHGPDRTPNRRELREQGITSATSVRHPHAQPVLHPDATGDARSRNITRTSTKTITRNINYNYNGSPDSAALPASPILPPTSFPGGVGVGPPPMFDGGSGAYDDPFAVGDPGANMDPFSVGEDAATVDPAQSVVPVAAPVESHHKLLWLALAGIGGWYAWKHHKKMRRHSTAGG